MDITTTVINQQFLGSLELTHRITGLKSPKGTGKTHGISELLQSHKRKLVLGHRVALLAEAACRHNLEFYRDKKGVIRPGAELDKADGLAICVNSLPRLTLKNWKDLDIVVIDEASQFIEHLFGDLCKDNRRELLYKLGFILNNAEYVVLADADLDQDTIDFYRELMEKAVEAAVTINEFKPDREPYFELDSRGRLISVAWVLLTAGQKVMFHCSSKTQSDIIHRVLGMGGKKGFLIHGDNSETPEVVEFVQNINQSVLEYDFVVTSPTLETGVSIDVEYFDFVFLLASTGCALSAQKLHQMFHRVRHPKARLFCIEGQRVSSQELQPEFVQQQQLERSVTAKEVPMKLNDDGEWVPDLTDPMDKFALKQRTRIALKTNTSIHNLRNNFIEYIYQENPGHTVFLNCPLEAIGGLGSLLKGTKFLLDTDAQRAIVHAPDLTDQEAYGLLLGRLDKEKEAALTKWKMQRHYDTQQLSPEQLKGWLKGKTEERFENFLNTFWKTPRELDWLDKEQFYDPRILNSDMDNYGKKRELVFETIRRAFGSVGRALHGQLSVTKELLENNGFNEWFSSHNDELKFYLGLRAKDPLGALRSVLEWVGLGLETHRHYGRDPEEIPVMFGPKIAATNTLPTKVGPTTITVERKERYYSIAGFVDQLHRACRLEPKHKTVHTNTALLTMF